MLSFKDFMVVDYLPGMPDLVSYQAHKRKRGRIGEDVELEEKYEVKFAKTKKGVIKVKKFDDLEPAKEYLRKVGKMGFKGIVSKDGKPVYSSNDIKEGSSAQSRLDRRAAKHGLGKKSDKLKKASDFFSKPPPSYSKDDLRKMGHPVESVDLEENKIFFVKVGDGRDSMTVKTKASNSKEALSKVRGQYPKDRVSLDRNQKQGQPAGALESVEEKTLTPAEKKKREEIAKAMERDNPDMPMDKKMAIATATAKRVKEGTFRALRNEAKSAGKSATGYDIYHKTYSAAMQHAYAWAKKQGVTVDPSEIDDKVATGPSKPSKGKTNSFILKTNNPRRNLHVQVYGMDSGKYELNAYIS